MSNADRYTQAKAAQGYVPASDRQRCGTCRQSMECYGSTLQCRKGGFLITAYSVCDDWSQRVRPSGSSAPVG
jgi:hypothetical protein